MEGGEKQEERKIQKRRQGEGREHVSLLGGGDLWEWLNYKFATKIACGKLPLHP